MERKMEMNGKAQWTIGVQEKIESIKRLERVKRVGRGKRVGRVKRVGREKRVGRVKKVGRAKRESFIFIFGLVSSLDFG